mmetsp:Transcript_23683/g.39511  ORF Transcript_23683/g.39511 Transcript_23683/m.39511 type:complete len:293 (-) Transcript_23683:579-1457(-)
MMMMMMTTTTTTTTAATVTAVTAWEQQTAAATRASAIGASDPALWAEPIGAAATRANSRSSSSISSTGYSNSNSISTGRTSMLSTASGSIIDSIDMAGINLNTDMGNISQSFCSDSTVLAMHQPAPPPPLSPPLFISGQQRLRTAAVCIPQQAASSSSMPMSNSSSTRSSSEAETARSNTRTAAAAAGTNGVGSTCTAGGIDSPAGAATHNNNTYRQLASSVVRLSLRVNEAVVLVVRHELEAARVLLEDAVRRDPDFAPAVHNLLYVYMKQGRRAHALRLIQLVSSRQQQQ